MNKKNTLNLILSAFLVIAFIICTYFFSTLNQTATTQSIINALVTAVFGLILFYATRVGDGKPVKRFSIATLVIMVLPSLYIILANLAPSLPLGDTLGNSSIVVCLAGVALGYGIPYTFLSGFEIQEETEEVEEVEDEYVTGGIMEELDATEDNDTEDAEDDTPVEDNQE